MELQKRGIMSTKANYRSIERELLYKQALEKEAHNNRRQKSSEKDRNASGKAKSRLTRRSPRPVDTNYFNKPKLVLETDTIDTQRVQEEEIRANAPKHSVLSGGISASNQKSAQKKSKETTEPMVDNAENKTMLEASSKHTMLIHESRSRDAETLNP